MSAPDPVFISTAAAPAPVWKPDVFGETLRHCLACDVQWRGEPKCWCCGKAVTA